MKKLIIAILVAAIMGGGLCGAQAGTLTLSTMSSDSTPADVLDANITFDVVASSLTIDVTNLSDYDITEIYFNASDAVTSLSSSSLPTDWELVIGDGDTDTKADGFGIFDYLIRTTNDNSDGGIQNGAPLTSFMLTIAGIGSWSQFDFDNEWSVPPPSERLALVAMKFMRGPGPPDDDSAFGAVPEPSTVVLLGLGSLLLLHHRRRLRGG